MADPHTMPAAREAEELTAAVWQRLDELRRGYEAKLQSADGRLGSLSMREMAAARTDYEQALLRHGAALLLAARRAQQPAADGRGDHEMVSPNATEGLECLGREEIARLVHGSAFDPGRRDSAAKRADAIAALMTADRILAAARQASTESGEPDHGR